MKGIPFVYIFVWTYVVGSDGQSLEDGEDGLSQDIVIQARCQARCYDKFREVIFDFTLRKNEQETICQSRDCEECLSGCGKSSISENDCTAICQGGDNSGTCVESCLFRQSCYKDTLSEQGGKKTEQTFYAYHKWSMETEVVCKSIPTGSANCNTEPAFVVLKWEAGQSTVPSIPMYVIRSRQKHINNSLTNWTAAHMVPFTKAKVSGLQCDALYQFQVFSVLQSGQIGYSNISEWMLLPSSQGRLNTGLKITKIEQSLVHQKPSITLFWDAGSDASCFYKIFWFGISLPRQEEIEAPRDFRYQITDLEFSRNYTIKLFSYDNTFLSSIAEDMRDVLTPNCLEATSYNHSVCAPLEPNNLTIDILTPFHEDKNVRYVNVTLSWDPPIFTNNGNDVSRYKLHYRKEPPSNEAHRLQPDKGEREIQPNNFRNITLYNLHNHNYYRFELSAETDGGVGEKAVLKQYLETGTTNETLTGLRSATSTMESILLPEEVQHAAVEENLTSKELLAVVLVAASILVIVTAIVCLVLIRKRIKYKKYSAPRRLGLGPVEELNPIYGTCSVGGVHIDSEQKSKLKADGYEIDYSCLDFISVVGEGAFGKVVKAEYYPKPTDRQAKEGKIVAVKMLRDFYTGDESRNFVLEIQAMKNLGHHPYIVSIIGCCLTGPKLCLVMDYCALGDLRNYLRKYREKFMSNMYAGYGMMSKTQTCYMPNQVLLPENKRNSSCTNIDIEEIGEVSEAHLLSYARQITMGMEFLEQRKFVHRDLAARNILLFDHRHIKISDFGLTRDVYETNVYQPTSARKLPYKWMAIESLFSQRFTIKSDVWSFGIVLWEIVTLGGSPYPSIPLKDLYGLLNDGYRMEKPENCSSKVYQIMLSCWHPNPDTRPVFSQVRQDLEKLLEETRSYIDLSVEVSGDYFNESTNESPLLGFTQHDQVDGLPEECASSVCDEYLESQNLFVDIHNEPNKSDTTDEPSHNCSATAIQNVSEQSGIHVVDNKVEMCSQCEEIDENNEKENDCNSELLNCESCNIKRAKSLNSHWKERASLKTSLKDSLKNILDAVGTLSSSGSPTMFTKFNKSSKKCTSLTDISDIESVRTTTV